MWWWLDKKEETEEAAIYEYGVATQDVSGKILINKQTKEVTRIKRAYGDSDELYLIFAGFVRSIIPEAGYPIKRSIAIG